MLITQPDQICLHVEEEAGTAQSHSDLRVSTNCSLQLAQRKETSKGHEDTELPLKRKWLVDAYENRLKERFPTRSSDEHFSVA